MSSGTCPLPDVPQDECETVVKEIETLKGKEEGCNYCGSESSSFSYKMSPGRPSQFTYCNLNSSLLNSMGDRSFEGVGGNTNLDPVDLQNQVSELTYQVRKLTEDNVNLNTQLASAEEEKFSLQCQAEKEKEKQSIMYKANRETLKRKRERIEQLSKELEDTKYALSNAEDSKSILRNQHLLLERNYFELNEANETLATENNAVLSQLETGQKRLKSKNDELMELKIELNCVLADLFTKKLDYEEALTNLQSNIAHLEETNDQLVREAAGLEKKLSVAKVPDHHLEFSICTEDAVEEDCEDDDTFEFRTPYSSLSYQNNSLHAEITAAMKGDSSPFIQIFGHQSSFFVDAFTQCEMTEDDANTDVAHLNRLQEIVKFLRSVRMLICTESSKNGDSVYTEESPSVVAVEVDEIEESKEVPVPNHEFESTREEMVRCINEELAEFREQLKQSQELIYALSKSAHNVDMAESCTGLDDTDSIKSQLVNCSTQTDLTVINKVQDSYHQSNCREELYNDAGRIYASKQIDDISYRLPINLSTVLEESEQETETSPATVLKRMSSEKGNRPKLVRMKNATEEDPQKEDEDDAFLLDNYPNSRSMYDSLERPVQLSEPLGGDLDSDAIEMVTNHDGDKTPVNEEDGHEKDDGIMCSTPIQQSSNGVLLRRRTWGPPLPIDRGHRTYPIGVIQESQKHQMVQYAYDPPRRVSEKVADILTPKEWRILRVDLDRQTQANYTKRFAQEEGHDVDGGMEGGPQKSQNFVDLDDEAEEYCEIFPELVEQLFKNLDNLKGRGIEPSQSQLVDISQRFSHLAHAFKTEHINMDHRSELKKKERDNSRGRLKEICELLKTTSHKVEETSKTQKIPDEITEVFSSLKDTSQELDHHSSTLSETARRLGMLDAEMRMYKMIEVMVLYVHILKNLYDNVEKDYRSARKLLDEHNIPFDGEKSLGKLNNNNNDGIVTWSEGYLGEGQLGPMEKYEDGRPKQILQHLLGPKESNSGLKNNLKENLVLPEKSSWNSVVVRYVKDCYEVLRRELYWPWTFNQTWKGIKHGFAIILMVVGLLLILRNIVFPIVSADDKPSNIPQDDLGWFIARFGTMFHPIPPPV